MKSFLVILNEGPYGSERPYNELRLAMTLQKKGATWREFERPFEGPTEARANIPRRQT